MWTFGRRIAVGFALSFLLLLLVGSLSYRSIDSLTRTSYAVSHSHEVLDVLSDLLAVVAETEGEYRGYVITSEENYVPEVRGRATRHAETEDKLRALLVDNPLQQRNAEAVIQQADAKVAFGVTAFDLFRKQGRDARGQVGCRPGKARC